ncbi:ABC transporter ATP-binding protein [Microvirga rosea]|uniref:ABC transporter ATP-binding protein n=1 Tax=Microvirga rosea TaxID=2715425 RepID=UPI001D0A3821|nr:ABC transporter ATP-binding protein [Microvirga rosea]MCB8820160.1 ABC transporter ATP-binding protein [Microvirga rosea]
MNISDSYSKADIGISLPENAIEANALTKIYRLYDKPVHQFLDAMGLRWAVPKSAQPKEFHALANVDLVVPKGARLGLMGRNGAGKTTLLKLLTGNFVPTSGQLRVNGKVIALIEIGAGFHPEFSGLENIRSSLSFNGLPREDFEAAVEDVIEFCELGPFLGQPLKTYSLGMKSRLYFACATAVKPDILIIDEVLGAGDTYFGIKSAERMKKLTGSGCTLILVSHSTAQLMQFCETAVWLEQGRVVSQGKTLEVVKLYDEFIRELDNTRLTRTSGSVLAENNEWLRSQIISKVLINRAEATDTIPGNKPDASPSAGSSISQREEETPERLALLKEEEAPEFVSEGGVSRWPGAPGPKVGQVSLSSQFGPASQLITGDAMTLRMQINCTEAGRYRCRYSVMIYTDDLRTVCRFHSPVHVIEVGDEPAQYDVDLILDQLQLSNGEYIVTVGIFDDHELDRLQYATRYDNLSLSFRFRVVDTIRSEQALFHHPCTWRVQAQRGVEAMEADIQTGIP